MTETHAARLAARFRDDAQALRARATVLDAQGPARQGGGGPSAAACRAMADACDRVSTLFAGAPDDAALAAVLPQLERLRAGERAPDAKHVYDGALTRVRQTLAADGAADDDDDDEFDDDDADDEE